MSRSPRIWALRCGRSQHGIKSRTAYPSAEMQQALDTTLERAGEGAQARFTRNLAETSVRVRTGEFAVR